MRVNKVLSLITSSGTIKADTGSLGLKNIYQGGMDVKKSPIFSANERLSLDIKAVYQEHNLRVAYADK